MIHGRLLALPALLALLVVAGCSDPTPRVRRVYPDFSSLRGNEDVRIEGSGFRSDIGYTVYFGTQRAASVTVENEGLLVATTPGVDSPREVDVRIVADNGKTFMMKKAFRYIDGSIDQRLFYGADAKKASKRVHR